MADVPRPQSGGSRIKNALRSVQYCEGVFHLEAMKGKNGDIQTSSFKQRGGWGVDGEEGGGTAVTEREQKSYKLETDFFLCEDNNASEEIVVFEFDARAVNVFDKINKGLYQIKKEM